MYYLLVILVKIPTHQELMQKREVTSESNSLSVIGDMAPSFTIPSAVVLRRMTEEGTVYTYVSTKNCKLLATVYNCVF